MTMAVRTRQEYSVQVPAGEYFLGDPCYAVPDELWMPLLESNNVFGVGNDDGPHSGPVGTVNGVEVLGFGTAYGDGVYRDQFGNHFPVDAGMIGLTPMELVPDSERAGLEGLGVIVTFPYPVTCEDDGEGRLRFGRHEINTADDDEDESDAWDEDPEW
jgi:hypothetical protein